MQITVSGKGVDVGESLRGRIETRLAETIGKYLDRVTQVQVIVSREAHMFRVDVHANTGTHAGIVISGRAEGTDIYGCADQAIDKIQKQLRRYKRRLTNHHKKSSDGLDVASIKAMKYVLQPESEHEEAPEEAAPVIIAEKSTDVETLTVSQAVMKMDLEDLPALMFFNSAHGRINVVYRRVDGNISWVDPMNNAA